MIRKPKNHGKAWSDEELKELKHLAEKDTPISLIAQKLERTEFSIRSRAHDSNILLRKSVKISYNKKISD